ncbi:hypothetical protein [Burkholderia stagnalis]|nr:hypothetical protein [Burkholderia stagnalis]MDY7802614.1 hypothetical protein [Burkholderia stagnalis]
MTIDLLDSNRDVTGVKGEVSGIQGWLARRRAGQTFGQRVSKGWGDA